MYSTRNTYVCFHQFISKNLENEMLLNEEFFRVSINLRENWAQDDVREI